MSPGTPNIWMEASGWIAPSMSTNCEMFSLSPVAQMFDNGVEATSAGSVSRQRETAFSYSSRSSGRPVVWGMLWMPKSRRLVQTTLPLQTIAMTVESSSRFRMTCGVER